MSLAFFLLWRKMRIHVWVQQGVRQKRSWRKFLKENATKSVLCWDTKLQQCPKVNSVAKKATDLAYCMRKITTTTHIFLCCVPESPAYWNCFAHAQLGIQCHFPILDLVWLGLGTCHGRQKFHVVVHMTFCPKLYKEDLALNDCASIHYALFCIHLHDLLPATLLLSSQWGQSIRAEGVIPLAKDKSMVWSWASMLPAVHGSEKFIVQLSVLNVKRKLIKGSKG